MGFLLALAIAIPFGIGVWFFLSWLEKRWADGAEDRQAEADQKAREKRAPKIAGNTRDRMEAALARKNEGSLNSGSSKTDFFGERVLKKPDSEMQSIREILNPDIEEEEEGEKDLSRRKQRNQPSRKTKSQRKGKNR